jgi:hypothetical protein
VDGVVNLSSKDGVVGDDYIEPMVSINKAFAYFNLLSDEFLSGVYIVVRDVV